MKSDQPLVSIIVPCYNQAEFLDECLDSVLAQTYQNWECIIVNDGSPDNTKEVAQKWCKRDSRFSYIEKNNGGLSNARNTGLKNAKGDFIQFLDSDDILTKHKFEIQLGYAVEKNIDIVISGYDFLRDNSFSSYEYSDHIPDCTPDGFIYGWDLYFIIPIHTSLFSNAFLTEKKLLFNENLRAKEDWLFWINCTLNGARFFYHPDKLAHYRMHESNMAQNFEFMTVNNIRSILEVYDLLCNTQREKYKTEIPLVFYRRIEELLKVKIHKIENECENRIKNTKTYLIGKFFLTVPQTIKRFFQRKK